MGTEPNAEELEDEIDLENKPDELDEDDSTDKTKGDGPEDDDQVEDDEDEIGITRQVSDSQPSKKNRNPQGVRKRIDKLTGKVKDAEGKVDEVQVKLDLEKQKNVLYQTRIEQLEETGNVPVRPNVDDFDGSDDPKFLKAQDVWDDHRVDQRVDAKLNKRQETSAKSSEDERKIRAQDQRIEAHVLRSMDLGAKNFDLVEEKAIKVLGQDTVKGIIELYDGSDGLPGSEVLVYYFGLTKNIKQANELKDLVAQSSALGIDYLGRLRGELNKPESKSKHLPDPDDEIEGSSASGSEGSNKKLDRLRDRVAKSGKSSDMQALMDYKKKLKVRAQAKK